MKTPTFEQQFQKIVQAYYRNELEPCNPCACFVGNLLNNSCEWAKGRFCWGSIITEDYEHLKIATLCVNDNSGGFYTLEEILELETIFMNIAYSDNEEDLYNAMTVTLQKLRELHELKGETVKDYQFQKRELLP